MDSAPAALRSIANKWRAKSPPATSPLPNVTGFSRKMAMGAISASVNVDEPPLRELNNALRVLVEMFPNIQAEVFREMLLNTSEESRLQMVTENLLRDEGKCVRGRVRVPGGAHDGSQTNHHRDATPGRPTVTTNERFRSLSYKTAVADALSQEFKGLSRSTIIGLLAECNHSYTQSRQRLLELSVKSWRFSFTRFIFRRKIPAMDEHPLLVWEPYHIGSLTLTQPTLRFTQSTELNLELWNTLVQPVLDKQKLDQEVVDRGFAIKLAEEQAEGLGEIYDCGCCFISYPMELLSSCTDQNHYICHICIRHTANEALFGQGWAKSIDHERCTLKCIAPNSPREVACEGFIPSMMVQKALDADMTVEHIWEKLHDKCAAETLLKSRLLLAQCPFCPYAEVDDSKLQKVNWRWRPLPSAILLAYLCINWIALTSSVLRYITQPLVVVGFLYVGVQKWTAGHNPVAACIEQSLLRITRKKRGLRFVCQSSRCRRSSCLNCHKAWSDIHICYESSKLALRAAIEAATTDVVKRTCPVCSLSFVKAAGCNKLACVCGYTMCYVCRQEIGKESYTHFCQHFRQRPGEPCRECDRCDLYKVEDEEHMVREAALRAEKEWWEQELAAEAGVGSSVDQDAREVQLNALEEETLPLTSAGRVHALVRALGSKAKWERLLDKILSEFIE